MQAQRPERAICVQTESNSLSRAPLGCPRHLHGYLREPARFPPDGPHVSEVLVPLQSRRRLREICDRRWHHQDVVVRRCRVVLSFYCMFVISTLEMCRVSRDLLGVLDALMITLLLSKSSIDLAHLSHEQYPTKERFK